MKRLLPSRARTPVGRRNSYRPHLEQLEYRLPPGVVLGLLPGSWITVSPRPWDPPSATSELALVEPLADTPPSSRADDSAIFGRLAAADVISFSSSMPAERNPDEPALASLLTSWTPIPGNRAADRVPVSAAPALSFLSETAAQVPAGAIAPANLTSGLSPSSAAEDSAAGAPMPRTQSTVHRPAQLGATSVTAALAPKNKSQVLESYSHLPLRFESNQGQTDARVQFISPGNGSTLFLTASEAVLIGHTPVDRSVAEPVAATGSALHMQVVGANASSQPIGEQELPGKVNYFFGNDPAQWHTDIPTYAKVEYPNIYDGIDLLYYGNQQQLEYDFVVKPGADPAKINLAFNGADQLNLDSQGDLLLHTATGSVRQHKPIIYQEINGIRQAITGSYVLQGPERVGFRLGAYDPSHTVVIDPVLAYSTYLGGSMDDVANAIAVDSAGNVYVTGDTTSMDFPTASPMQATYGGGTSNAFVTKLDPTGSTLLYSTYLGGEGFDRGNGIAVDATGSVYIVGKTNSRLFPIVHGAFEDTFRGDEFDAFVTMINPAGNQLSYSTYLGGNDNDAGIAIALDSSGDAYVTGGTKSHDFPATLNAYQGANHGGTNAFVTELNPSGTNVLYSTFLGGSFVDRGNAIAVDASGLVYVAGQTNSDDFPTKNALQANYGGGLDNAFVAVLDPRASGDDSLIYSTFLGGSGKDLAWGIAVDGAGNVYVTGNTSSAADFPIVNALQPTYGGGSSNVFVAKIDPTGTALLFATYLGGSGEDRGSALALDASANIYVTGSTSSADFPTMNALQPLLAGRSNAFVTKLTSDGGALVFSTYLGGSGDENFYQNGVNSGAIAVDAAGAVYVAGKTTSVDFPTVNPVQPMLLGTTSAFLAKLIDPGPNAAPPG